MAETAIITWDDSITQGVTNHKIYRDDVSIGIVGLAVGVFYDTNTVAGATYKYEVQAIDSVGESIEEVLYTNVFYISIPQVIEPPVTTLTPIMTNFRVEDATPTQVHFDTPLGPVTGLTTTGFVMSGKSISAVDTVNNYFTVTVAFNFWDNNTIRLGENTDTTNSSSVVHNFTLEDIVNNIEEPVSTIDRYVTNAASGSGNGTNDTDQAWTLSQAQTGVAPGTTVWVKVGDYGSTVFTPNSNGTISNPVKWIGYKTVKGDITENYLSSYNGVDTGISTDWDVNEMPTLSGASTVYTEAAIRLESSYNIIRNFQTTGWGTTMVEYDPNLNYIVIDNFNSKDNYSTTDANFGGIVLTRNTGLTYLRLKNIVLLNHSMAGIALQGDSADFNLMENIKGYSDRTQEQERQDYHISFNGNNTIVKDCYVENFNDTTTNGSTHGIGIKATGNVVRNDYNLITRCESVNQQECYYFRNYDVRESVIKDSIGRGNGSTSFQDCGGVWFWGGVRRNVIERVTIKDMTFCGIGLYDNAESPTWNEIGEDNTIRNCIFDNVKFGIYSDSSGETSEFNNNYFYNNTFTGITEGFYSHQGTGTVPITNLQIYNNIIEDCASAGTSGLSGFVFDYNTFWNSWTTGIGANDINENPNLVDYLPDNEALYVDGYPNLYYDLNKKERTTPKSTIGAVTLVSEQAGTEPPVTDIDYYVSSTGTGDGSTEVNPMSYAEAKTQLSSMLPGEVMAFKRGDVFTSELVIGDLNGTSGNEIILTAYGTGDLPKIDTVAEFDLTWTPQGGDVWTTPDPGFGRRIKVNGTEVLVSPIHSELGTDIGDVVMFTYDGGSLYYSGATDPNTLTIEAPTASRAIRVNIGSHFIIENIEVVGSTDQGILLYGTDNVIIRDLTVGEMCKGGIALAYSATYGRNTNTSFIDNTVDTKYTLDYSGATQNSLTSEQFGGEDGIRYYDCIGGEVSGNYVKNWGHAGISMTATTSTSDVIENINIFDNTLTSPDIAYGGRFVAEYEFRNSEIYNNNFIELKNHSHIHGHDNHYHHNIFKDITPSPIKTYRQYGVDMNAQYGDVYNNIVENNLFVNIPDGAIDIEENGTLVYGNTFRNNIAFECGFDNSNRGMSVFGGSSNTFNDNLFYIDGQISQVYYYTGNVDIATFNTQTSNSNSISGNEDSDPLFVGVSDYHLTESSPAVNAAATALATLDYDGNTIPYPTTLPDIGIYESDFII